MSYLQYIPRSEAPNPSFELLRPHLEAGHDLIPLKPLSDEPTHFDWPSMLPLSADEARAHMAAGGNIGVRLRPDMLVADVEPHYRAPNAIPWLENTLGVSLPRGPLVLSGRGTQQLYFKKPAHLRIWHHSGRLPGVRFTSSIGWVLASGSVHPTWHHHNRCEILQDIFADAPMAPSAMLDRIAARGRSQTASLTPEMLAACLKSRNPIHDPWWLSFVKATHRATRGTGREQVVAWAMSDPNCSRERMEALWNSLHADRHDHLGYDANHWQSLSRIEWPRGRRLEDHP